VLTITLRDLQYRRRQFGIAVLGAALVFALTLLLTGVSAGFRTEAQQTVEAVGADAWIVPAGVEGPFTSGSTLRADMAEDVARRPGVRRAIPIAEFSHQARRPDGTQEQINVIGQPRGGVGPGALAPPAGRAIVSERLEVDVGDTISIAELRFRVDRVVEGSTYYAGAPIVWLSLGDAQELGFDGRPLASAIVTQGTPRDLPRGLEARDPGAIEHDIRTPIANAVSTIDAIRILMWLVAALIIGAVTYLSALDRLQDFAVLKAVGGSSRTLALSLTFQALLAALLAAALAVALSELMEPLMTIPVVSEFQAVVLLFAIAVFVGVLSSAAALQRAIAVDPALAFGG
jgi:putative ABC transport system permease protein